MVDSLHFAFKLYMEECHFFLCMNKWVVSISLKLLNFKFQGFNLFLEIFQNFEVFQEVLTYQNSVSQLG